VIPTSAGAVVEPEGVATIEKLAECDQLTPPLLLHFLLQTEAKQLELGDKRNLQILSFERSADERFGAFATAPRLALWSMPGPRALALANVRAARLRQGRARLERVLR